MFHAPANIYKQYYAPCKASNAWSRNSIVWQQANGKWHEESDWDILVLTTETVTRDLKNKVQASIFSLSIKTGSFINLLLVQEDDWNNNASYLRTATIPHSAINYCMSEKQQAIQLKLTKARQLLSEVVVLMQNGFYTTNINRFYYSCFHATKAYYLPKIWYPKHIAAWSQCCT